MRNVKCPVGDTKSLFCPHKVTRGTTPRSSALSAVSHTTQLPCSARPCWPNLELQGSAAFPTGSLHYDGDIRGMNGQKRRWVASNQSLIATDQPRNFASSRRTASSAVPRSWADRNREKSGWYSNSQPSSPHQSVRAASLLQLNHRLVRYSQPP